MGESRVGQALRHFLTHTQTHTHTHKRTHTHTQTHTNEKNGKLCLLTVKGLFS